MTDTSTHGQLMDQTYRYQRLIYDLTRKYYLLGRDRLIANMGARPGARVLEVACGTGRNLSLIRAHYPEAKLFGLDISEQMLVTARSKLGDSVRLANADACDFDPKDLFDVDGFDHIVLSYSLSMIPDWEQALVEARRHLAPGGQLHVVDFGDSAGLPAWFQRGLRAWLTRFHVAPRASLERAMRNLESGGGQTTYEKMYRSYAVYGTYTEGQIA